MTGDAGRQVPAPTMNPHAQSHEALKAMTDAADPAGAQAVADGWAELASGFDEAARLFERTVLNSASGWTGDAADGMRAQLARIAMWSEQTGAQYRAASGAIAEQSGAADTAKRNMPLPVPYDPAQMIRDARESGNLFELAALPFKMYAQKQRHDAAHAQAAEVVVNRDTAFSAAAGAVPAFIPPPSLASEPEGTQRHVVAVEGTQRHVAATPSPPIPVTEFGPSGSGGAVPAARVPVAETPAPSIEADEQKRPEYLVESELGGMFGSEEMTAPPVIGEV